MNTLVDCRRGADFQVCLQCTAGRKGQRHTSLLVALAQPEDHRAASFPKHQVVQFQGHQIADTGSRCIENKEKMAPARTSCRSSISRSSRRT